MQTLEQLKSGALSGSTRIKLSCNLKEVPPEIFNLTDTLEILDLSGNGISELPENFGDLIKLRILFLSDNNFTKFPNVLSQCTHLEMIGFKANKIEEFPEYSLPPKIRWLILTNNKISEIPVSIGDHKMLQKVMLAGNQLKTLPKEMAACTNIELLRISANQFSILPEWIYTMPKLAWLAIGGNPISKHIPLTVDPLIIDWSELVVKEKLGEGASGIISKAFWGKENKEVAVKVFKGEVTSDGYPEDEMQICIASGNLPYTVKVLGRLSNHPEKKSGLVFDLIPKVFQNLGGTPSFQSCTRDIFAENTFFTYNQIHRILSGIASAAYHLHEKGIIHGDLYAHNILTDPEANPVFGDFGAGAYYKNGSLNKELLEKIEVRAFGYLMDDLLGHISEQDRNLTPTLSLINLMNECLDEKVKTRPFFKDILEHLQIYLTQA